MLFEARFLQLFSSTLFLFYIQQPTTDIENTNNYFYTVFPFPPSHSYFSAVILGEKLFSCISSHFSFRVMGLV